MVRGSGPGQGGDRNRVVRHFGVKMADKHPEDRFQAVPPATGLANPRAAFVCPTSSRLPGYPTHPRSHQCQKHQSPAPPSSSPLHHYSSAAAPPTTPPPPPFCATAPTSSSRKPLRCLRRRMAAPTPPGPRDRTSRWRRRRPRPLRLHLPGHPTIQRRHRRSRRARPRDPHLRRERKPPDHLRSPGRGARRVHQPLVDCRAGRRHDRGDRQPERSGFPLHIRRSVRPVVPHSPASRGVRPQRGRLA